MQPTIILILIVAVIYLGGSLYFASKRNAHLRLILTRARKGYSRWLGSYAWKLVAEASKRRDKYTCRLCGRKRPHVQLQSHHPDNYDEILYDEKPEDLTTLCAECHEAITIMLRLRRRGVAIQDVLLPEFQEMKKGRP